MMKQLTLITALIVFSLLMGPINLAALEHSEAETYFDNLVKGNYDQCFAMSSHEMQKAMSADLLKQTWESLPAQAGQMLEVIKTTTEVKDSYTTYIFAVNFELMVLDILVTQDKDDAIAGLLFRPSSVQKPGAETKLPDYLTPENIIEQEYDFDCEGLTLHGKLTIPKGLENYPVVLMLSGSGPNDMDETIGPRKPFRDLAYGLAGQGVASLRWTKRTRDYPDKLGELRSFTVRDEYLPELQAALISLIKNQDVKAKSFFVLGHSLGGMILPMAATEMENLTGFIMLAANARPLEDLVVEQYKYIFGLDGISTEEQEQLNTIIEQAKVVKQLDEEKPAPENLLLGVPKAYWLSLNYYNQVELFTKAQQPFLILQGEKDYQVSMEDFALWTKAADSKKNVELKSYPDLDHLFMYNKDNSTPESYMTPAFVDEKVIRDIAVWVTTTSRE